MPTPAPPPSLDWCLFLDVDGTLIDLTDTPFDPHSTGALQRLLAEVAERLGGALALVSGRSIEYLDSLFAPLRLPSAGLHGVERRKATGRVLGATFQDSHLDGARAALAALVQSHAGTLLEDKGRTVAIHFRLAPQFEAELREQVAAIAASLGSDYHVQSGSMMLEIKPRGFNKGHAVRAFLQEPPFSGRTPVYIGDDLTDIDGFKVVEEYGGVSIAVGDRVTGQHRLENPRAVFGWLEGIAGLVDLHR
jgi:trehalose 6-phosphate phosphatase